MHSLIDNFRTSLESLVRVRAKQTFVQALLTMSPIEAVEQIVLPSLEQIGEALTALSQQEPDKVPFFLLTTLYSAKEMSMTIEHYFSKSENVVEGQKCLLKKYRGDCLIPFYYASIEIEAWGGYTLFSPDGPPLCGSPIILNPDDILHKNPPEVYNSPSLLKVLETIKQLKLYVGDTVPIIGVSSLENIGELKKVASGRVSLLANFNGIEMRRWSSSQAENEIKRIIALAGKGGGLLLGDNHGEIPWQVSDEVLIAKRDAVDRWGNYPLDWIDESQNEI